MCAVERKDGEGDEKGEEEGMEEGEIVGAACWVVRKGRGGDGEKEGEGKEEEGVNAHWHVEGSEEKAFAEELIGQLRSFVKQRVGAREHIGASTPFFPYLLILAPRESSTYCCRRNHTTLRRTYASPPRCRASSA